MLVPFRQILSLGDRNTLGVLFVFSLLSLALLALTLLSLALALLFGLRGLLLILALLLLLGRVCVRLARLRGGGLGNVEVFHFLLDSLRGHVDVVSWASMGRYWVFYLCAMKSDIVECESPKFTHACRLIAGSSPRETRNGVASISISPRGSCHTQLAYSRARCCGGPSFTVHLLVSFT